MADQIFISYRRDDAAYVTGHINDLLRKEFGDAAVFTDVDNIALGVDFRAVLDETVSQCHVLLAVIGSNWLTVRDKDGQLRLNDPADFVRIEIESALNRNIPVIPLLVSGAKMPAAEDLPESLRPLAFRNGIQIRPAPDFGVDMARLVKNLQRHFESIRTQGEPELGIDTTSSRPSEASADRQPPGGAALHKEPESQGGSNFTVEVDQEDRARHQAELGIEKRKKKNRLASVFAILVIAAVAAGAWFYLGESQEPRHPAPQSVRQRQLAQPQSDPYRQHHQQARRAARSRFRSALHQQVVRQAQTSRLPTDRLGHRRRFH